MRETHSDTDFRPITKKEIHLIWLNEQMWRIRELQGLKRPARTAQELREV